MMLVRNMTSSKHLRKPLRAVASKSEQVVHQTHAGRHAQMQCAMGNMQVNPLQTDKHYGKHT